MADLKWGQRKKKEPNRTGIPDRIKNGMEQSTGLSFDNVKVTYNSKKPETIQALAYTQGNQVYIGPGQEKHLGHELGHVVQQKLGMVRPTRQVKGVKINDNEVLERQASDIYKNALSYSGIKSGMGKEAARGQGTAVQMRDDTARIIPAQVGTDPFGPDFGMSAHHVIPQGMLERFYNLCNANANGKQRSNFNMWVSAAKSSTEKSSAIRAVLTDQNYTQSAAQWMAGNIFIGPIANVRIDDMHSDAEFDFGVYNSRKEDKKIVRLKAAFDYLTKWFALPNDNARMADTDTIDKILDILIKVAQETTTLHKNNNNTASPAYKLNDWVSVGNNVIEKRIDKKKEFNTYYSLYNKYSKITVKTNNQINYMSIFCNYINIQTAFNTVGGILVIKNGEWIMARKTFSIIQDAYDKYKEPK